VTRLAGKVALITGGGTGIGRGIALAFGARGRQSGGRRPAAGKIAGYCSEIQAAGGEAIAAVCDVSRAAGPFDRRRRSRCGVRKLMSWLTMQAC